MAKDDISKVEDPAAEVEQEITLDEFCMRKSRTDKRVEMLGAFHHVEVVAAHTKDTETAYAARYSAFINKPV